AVSLGIDSLRAIARRRRYEQAAAQMMMTQHLPIDPFDQLYRVEQARRVRAALARMKRQSAQLLILRNCGLSYQELSDTLDIKVGSVGTLLARAEAEFAQRYRALLVPLRLPVAGAIALLLCLLMTLWHCDYLRQSKTISLQPDCALTAVPRS